MASTFTEWKNEGPQITDTEAEQFRRDFESAVRELVALRKAQADE